MTTGASIIRGKKNFLSPGKLEVGFGLLYKVDESCIGFHTHERRAKLTDDAPLNSVLAQLALNPMAASITLSETEVSGTVAAVTLPVRATLRSPDSIPMSTRDAHLSTEKADVDATVLSSADYFPETELDRESSASTLISRQASQVSGNTPTIASLDTLLERGKKPKKAGRNGVAASDSVPTKMTATTETLPAE